MSKDQSIWLGLERVRGVGLPVNTVGHLLTYFLYFRGMDFRVAFIYVDIDIVIYETDNYCNKVILVSIKYANMVSELRSKVNVLIQQLKCQGLSCSALHIIFTAITVCGHVCPPSFFRAVV